jgi:FAD/FMN-containing dehydrogenase
MASVSTSTLQALQQNFLGELIIPGDARYEAARKVWNADIDRRPALIARCRGVADVAAAVLFAREHELLAAVRGGAHSVAGHSVCDGGMVIDLSLMTGVRVDPVQQTIRVQGGALNEHLDREAQHFGLATTSGIVSHTGVAGLTRGGGIGHLMRRCGRASDNRGSCDVVTADGATRIASATEDAALFWGLRGGGGNFGIATSFEFRLQRIGPQVLAGMLAWPLEKAREVLPVLDAFAAEAPDEVGLMAAVRQVPPLPHLPAELHGRPIVAVIPTYTGPIESGVKALAPLLQIEKPLINTVAPKPYVAHQKMFDLMLPHGRGYYWRAHRLGRLSGELIDVLVAHAERITSPWSTVPIYAQGGAVARVREDASAFAGRNAPYETVIVAAWMPGDPERDKHIEWARSFHRALEPYSQGVYVNYVNDEPLEQLRSRAYTPQQWNRLVKLKADYDPTNFFRLNANISPPTSAAR